MAQWNNGLLKVHQVPISFLGSLTPEYHPIG